MKIYMSNIEQIKNITDLEKQLSESDMKQYKQFSNKTRKLQYLVSHAIVQNVCGESIIVNQNGAPTIKSGFISIAHKDNWVLVAVADSKVGIDIENTTNCHIFAFPFNDIKRQVKQYMESVTSPSYLVPPQKDTEGSTDNRVDTALTSQYPNIAKCPAFHFL